MKKITVFLLLFAFFCTFSTMFAEDDDKLILAVMEFDDLSGNLPKEMLSGATEYMRSAFVASNKFIVIAKERQEKAMIKKMKEESYKLCNDKNCQIPLGKALSADTILRTSINFFGGTYTITSELISLEKEATEVGTNATFNGSEDSLKAALDSIVANIIGNKAANIRQGKFKEKPDHKWQIEGTKAFIVKFLSNPLAAAVIVDGKMICDRTPCSKQIDLGVHTIEMQKENYMPTIKEENISSERTIQYTLEEDFARLNINGNYATEVTVDGKSVGELPIKNYIVKIGPHRIAHRNGCFYNSGEDVVVKRGEKKEIYLQLELKESAIQVNIKDTEGNDIKGDVYVDGQYIGIAPDTFKIPFCSQKLTITSGNGEYRQNLHLKEGEVSKILATITYGQTTTFDEAKANKIKNEKINEELDKAGRKKRIAIATGIFIPGIAVTVLGGISFIGMENAEMDRKKYYGKYLDAVTEQAAVSYRKKALDADKRRKTYAILGGVGIGVGIAMMTTGIVFYSIDFKGEKEVKKKYNLSFGTSPMDGTLQFALSW